MEGIQTRFGEKHKREQALTELLLKAVQEIIGPQITARNVLAGPSRRCFLEGCLDTVGKNLDIDVSVLGSSHPMGESVTLHASPQSIVIIAAESPPYTHDYAQVVSLEMRGRKSQEYAEKRAKSTVKNDETRRKWCTKNGVRYLENRGCKNSQKIKAAMVKLLEREDPPYVMVLSAKGFEMPINEDYSIDANSQDYTPPDDEDNL